MSPVTTAAWTSAGPISTGTRRIGYGSHVPGRPCPSTYSRWYGESSAVRYGSAGTLAKKCAAERAGLDHRHAVPVPLQIDVFKIQRLMLQARRLPAPVASAPVAGSRRAVEVRLVRRKRHRLHIPWQLPRRWTDIRAQVADWLVAVQLAFGRRRKRLDGGRRRHRECGAAGYWPVALQNCTTASNGKPAAERPYCPTQSTGSTGRRSSATALPIPVQA